jgi:pyruvate dehydrogenase E2 component (dihydrolipoamide acetyltransferase)
VVKNDQIVVADRLRITMTCDHRMVYGADAALFMRELKRLLEQPVLLMV